MTSYRKSNNSATLRNCEIGIARLLANASSPASGRFHIARTDFCQFLKAVGRDERGGMLVDDEYTHILSGLLTACKAEGKHVSHIAPPGLGKSTLARLYLLWCIGRDNNLRTVIVSGSGNVSANAVSLCRDIILTENYKLVFPEIRTDLGKSRETSRGWRQSEFFLQISDNSQITDATLAAVSMEPIAENRRVDIGLFDDYLTRAIAHSPALKNRSENVFHQTWLDGRMAHGGWMLFVSNCWTTEDLGHQLRKDSRFCSFWVGLNADGTRLFVRLWNPPKETEFLSGYNAVAPQMGADLEYELPLPDGRLLASSY